MIDGHVTPGTVQPKAPQARGIRCPRCGCGHFRVIYTRKAARGRLVRRRECRHCGRRVTTSEQVLGCEPDPALVHGPSHGVDAG